MKTSRLAPVLLGGARLCAATTSTLQRCRHYAARRKPQRTGRQGREGIYSPTVAQKAAAPVERRAAAAEEQPRDTGITVIGSAALAVAVMGGCTLAYRFYTFGEASKPAEPLDAGQATSPPITVRALPSPVRAMLPERMLWLADDPWGRQALRSSGAEAGPCSVQRPGTRRGRGPRTGGCAAGHGLLSLVRTSP
eukprot:Transcript_4615.p2 GENE.Transcript_4615~~Transcript_4615.p2  ORF type:complete len:194 (+),score=14.47 Transcript_4615:32-613(+)